MMTVRELEKALSKIKNKNLRVVVDADENGYYSLEKIEVVNDEDGNEFLNLDSSNES